MNPYTAEIISNNIPEIKTMTAVDINTKMFTSQRKAIYDFLYMNPEPAKAFKVFKVNTLPNIYYAFGEVNTLKIIRDEI